MRAAQRCPISRFRPAKGMPPIRLRPPGTPPPAQRPHRRQRGLRHRQARMRNCQETTARRRVDARRLESALLEVRHQILDAPLFLEAPGVEEARAERRKLLSQIDDYLLPRLRESGSPVLVALEIGRAH